MKGFFSATDISSRRVSLSLIPQCGLCKLDKQCISPKMPVSGKGKRKILIVGEAPGKHEDEINKPFVGQSGKLLQTTLRKLGVELRQDCWITNALICRPKDNKITDNKVIEYCRPNIIKTVQELQPVTIILLGGVPVESLIGWLWKEDTGGIIRWAGYRIPCQRLNAWVCPTYHPSFLLRNADANKGPDVALMYFEKHLKAALRKEHRPFREVPDYTKQVNVILDPERAASLIRARIERGSPVAFDLETDRAKPDHKRSRILSCAVSDGITTDSYPWHGEAIKATEELLRSDVPKYGWNAKFENRWIRRILGFNVRNWQWDGMLAAHALDNRKKTKSLKFQAFVNLGQEDYDSELKPYMATDNSNQENRLRDVNLPKLLTYNGIDALLTFKLAKLQMKIMGVSV